MAKKQRVSVVGTVLTVEYPTIGRKFTVDFSKYSPEIQKCALAHGYKQKFGDAASGKSPQEKYDEVQEIHASLLANEWERTASPDMTAIVVEAVHRINPKKYPMEKLNKAAEAKPDQVKTWRANAEVKAMIAKILAERAAKRAEEAEDDEELNIEL